MNPLFNQLGGSAQFMPPQMQNMFQQFYQQFQQFAKGIRGDPRQQAQQMLNSGKISQAKYNQAVSMTNQIAPIFGIKK